MTHDLKFCMTREELKLLTDTHVFISLFYVILSGASSGPNGYRRRSIKSDLGMRITIYGALH